MERAIQLSTALRHVTWILSGSAQFSRKQTAPYPADDARNFSPTSVQFKSELNDAFPHKRHQKRHLEFCTAHLRSRMPQVRVLPGAPAH